MKSINLTPNWQQVFDFTIEIVRKEIEKDNGRELVIEMLQYGKRLDASKGEDNAVT